MDEEEEQEPDHVTTEEILNMISDVNVLHAELKDVEALKYKLRYSRKVVDYAEKKCERYRDLLRKSDSENYELKQSKVTLEEHNKLQKEFNDLKTEHHDLVNRSEIRYQKVNQELIAITNKYNALEIEYNRLKECMKKLPHSQGQILQLTKPFRAKTKKNKEINVQLQQENESQESQKLADLEQALSTKRNQIKELTAKLSGFEEHQQNEIKALNDQLKNEIAANNMKHQEALSTLNNLLRNKDSEIKELVGKLHSQIYLSRENSEIKTINNKLNNEMRESNNKQKIIDNLNDQLGNKDAETKRLMEELNALHLQINLSKDETVLVNCGTNCTDVNMLTFFNELNDHSNTEMANVQPQLEDIDRGETSDPATDEINSILNQMRHPTKLITPFSFESDLEPAPNKNMKNQELIVESKQVHDDNLEVPSINLDRKLHMKRKELNVTNKKLCITRRKLTIAERECYLQNKELLVVKKELHLIKNELRLTKKRLCMVKSYKLKRSNQKCNRVYHDQGTQCSETNNKKEDLTPAKGSSPPLEPNTINIEKKVFVQQLKIKKGLKQQLLDDIRKWHTDSFLSYPSDESDVESGLSQSTVRRKKFRKLRLKQLSPDSSDEDGLALDKENVQKKKTGKCDEKSTKPTSDLMLNDAEVDHGMVSSETIYAKAQGSVDSGYVKTDSGGESDVQSKSRKTLQNSDETYKKQRPTNSSKIIGIQEVQPENPANVKYWTRSMVKLFGTDSESYSSCLEASAKIQKVTTNMMRKPRTKYLQRVELEKSSGSSDSDFLRGFVNNCYSSIPKKNVLTSSQFSVVGTSIKKANTTKISQKQRKGTRQQTSCKELNINLISNDLNLSEGYTTTSTETETKTRNPLLDDGTEIFTCKVISSKPLLANRRSSKKVKPCIQSPTNMVLRSAYKKTDDESTKSSDCSASSIKSPSMRKPQKPSTCIIQEIEPTKKQIAHTPKHENVIESADSENGQSEKPTPRSPKHNEIQKSTQSASENGRLRKRRIPCVDCKATEIIEKDFKKQQFNDSPNSNCAQKPEVARINCKISSNELKNCELARERSRNNSKKPRDKVNSIEKTESDKNILKLNDDHPTTNTSSDEQLVVRKRAAEVLKPTTAVAKSIKIKDLDVKFSAIPQNLNSNFITKDQLTKTPPKAMASDPNVLPYPDAKNATPEFPDLPAPESPDLPNPDFLDFGSPASPNPECDNQKLCDEPKKTILCSPKHDEIQKSTQSASESGQSRKRNIPHVDCKAIEIIRIDFKKQQFNGSPNSNSSQKPEVARINCKISSNELKNCEVARERSRNNSKRPRDKVNSIEKTESDKNILKLNDDHPTTNTSSDEQLVVRKRGADVLKRTTAVAKSIKIKDLDVKFSAIPQNLNSNFITKDQLAKAPPKAIASDPNVLPYPDAKSATPEFPDLPVRMSPDLPNPDFLDFGSPASPNPECDNQKLCDEPKKTILCSPKHDEIQKSTQSASESGQSRKCNIPHVDCEATEIIRIDFKKQQFNGSPNSNSSQKPEVARINCKISSNDLKNHEVVQERSRNSKRPGSKINSIEKTESGKKILKLNDDHPTTNNLSNEQLLARKRVAEVLKFTTAVTKSNKQIVFKRPNTRRKKIEPLALPIEDSKVIKLKSNILPDLDVKLSTISQNVNFNFITKEYLTKAPTSELPDLPAPESPDLPDFLDFQSPASPNPECDNQKLCDEPKIIPLEASQGTWQAESILNQLLHYCKSEGMAQEVTNALLHENSYFIARLVLEVVSRDIHAKIDIFNYRRAPLLSVTQRLMLGLLLNLEEKGLKGVINSFLHQSEQLLITLTDPLHISPTARLHAALCKMQFDYKRMRLMLCKAVFCMGDIAIPYLYIVICSWLELIPLNNDNLSGHDALETRTLIQIIRLKQCTDPAYNLHNLQTLLNKYHGYSFDREDSEKLLEDLFKWYIKKNRTVLEDITSESIMYLTVALCENLDKNIVFKQINRLKIRLVVSPTNDEMYGVIYLVGIITSQYCEDSEVSADVSNNKEWLQQFCADSYPEYIKKAAMDVVRKL